MKICKVIAKALLAVFIILIIAYSTVFFYMVAKDDDYSDPICIGEFRSSDIDKIELICNDEQILITNDDDISEIVSCFSKRVYVNTVLFDRNNISGCVGLHWENDFKLKIFSKDNELSMNFRGCDSHSRSITRDFVIIDGENTFNHIFAALGADFTVSYNSEKLVEALNGYADISIVP